ncbi:hypothetical protein Vretimale_3633, partial [Volvox reticuliferus]
LPAIIFIILFWWCRCGMSSSTSVTSLQAAVGPSVSERAPLLGKEGNEGPQSEHMLRTSRGSNTPVVTSTCRICMDEEFDPISNPLISPCKCSGSTKYVHRQCLLKWRSMKSGTQAYYRCEICHYRYQFRRLWWAQVLGHPITSILIFSALLTASAWLLGYVPIMELMLGVPPGSHIGLHFLNGFLLVGLLGALALLIQLCVALPGSLPPGACNSCYCEPCPMVAIAGGEECLALLLVLLVSLAIAGLVWVCKTLYGTLYSTLRERMRWAEHMVEQRQWKRWACWKQPRAHWCGSLAIRLLGWSRRILRSAIKFCRLGGVLRKSRVRRSVRVKFS